LPVRRSLSSFFEDTSIKQATTVNQKGRNVGTVDSILGDSSSDNKEIVPLKTPKLPDGQALQNSSQTWVKTRVGEEKGSKFTNFGQLKDSGSDITLLPRQYRVAKKRPVHLEQDINDCGDNLNHPMVDEEHVQYAEF
jgi:hypothetical protein